MSEPVCSKCKGTMTEGFLVDHGTNGNMTQGEWSEGRAQPGFWTTVKKIAPRKVTTYCCDKCGLLESYASLPVRGSGMNL